MHFGVLLFVCRQRGERDLFQGLSELNKDQLSGLIGVAYLDSARHDGLHNIDAMPNSDHAVAINLRVARHSLLALGSSYHDLRLLFARRTSCYTKHMRLDSIQKREAEFIEPGR